MRGILGTVGIIFVVLKILGIISWSWIWVLFPFWIGIVLYLVIWILIYLLDLKQ